jgi:hypothetical protein
MRYVITSDMNGYDKMKIRDIRNIASCIYDIRLR